MSELNDRLGKRIRNKRIEKGLSQEALADLAELHSTYIGQVERGEKNVTINTLQKICRALDCPMSELIMNIDDITLNGKYSIAAEVYDITVAQNPPDQRRILQIVQEVIRFNQ